MYSSSSDKVPVNVIKRSGFDKSHGTLRSGPLGALIPIMVDEVIGNTTVNLRQSIAVTLPPLASDTYMNLKLKVEAFFVPHRILYGGFEEFFCQTSHEVPSATPASHLHKVAPVIPYLLINGSDIGNWLNAGDLNDGYIAGLGQGTLSDFLGLRCSRFSDDFGDLKLNVLPYLAYHMIYDNFYRSPLVQKSCFARPDNFSTIASQSYKLAFMPYICCEQANCMITLPSSPESPTDRLYLADDYCLFSLRFRNYGFDYFTNATPRPQFGEESSVSISNEEFTIAALRAANSFQQFKERNNLSGDRYADANKARTGADLSYGVAQRPVLLGSAVYDVYSKSVDVNAQTSSNISQNPFSRYVGASAGKAFGAGSDFIIDHFTCNESGYIFVIASLVPQARYAYGIDRILTRYTSGSQGAIADMANPLLQNIGPQPVLARELGDIVNDEHIFGYVDRYADWFTKVGTVNGLFRDSLSFMALQRKFSYDPDDWSGIDSDFLRIKPDDMDNVTAINAMISQYGCWIQSEFDYKVVMPMAEYSLPSLQDPAYEHGDTLVIHRGGFRL